MTQQNKVAGVILAGGLARRMQQQDKGLILLDGKPMVYYAINALAPLVDELMINANRNQSQYQQFGYPVISDQNNTFEGPLAGVLAAMMHTSADLLLVMPCDSPLMTAQHLRTLLEKQATTQAEVVVAHDGERLHPVFLVLKTTLKDSLTDYLASGARKIDRWLLQQHCVQADFSAEPAIFQNINTPDELRQLEEMFHAG